MTGPASRGVALAVALVLVIGWFATLGVRPLVRADESRYAEISREMVASGDWVTPRLNGYKYFEKPPLQYWATALAFVAFGLGEWTARLWTALTGFLAILFTWYVGNRLRGPPVGLLSAAVLASSQLFAALGHFNTLDMGVAAFLSVAVFAFLLAQLDTASAAARRGWMLVAWAAAALATLSKGLIGPALPAVALILYVLVERDWRLLARLHLASGVLLFLAITAPWFIAVARANPEFAHFFFIHEHLDRFLTKVHGRYQPMWYFVPILLGGLIPWTLTFFPALFRGARAERATRFRPLRFLVVWAATVFVFFSVSSSKLPSYILPIFPALAILIGAALPTLGKRWTVAQALAGAIGGVAAAIVAPALLMRAARPELPAALLADYVPWVVGAALALAVGSAIAAFLAWRGRIVPAALALAAAGFTMGQIALTGHGTLSPVYSAYHVVAQARSRLGPQFAELTTDAPFFSVETFDHSLLFYLRRAVTMVVYKDELAIPIGWAPQGFIPDRAGFERAWAQADRAYAMLPARDFDEWVKRGLPMTVIARDPRRVIVQKP
jgi:4-amino-4-deoxy-L-arabinose transferase-like glycosyltransferase